MSDSYDDDYGTCKETSASFRITHPSLDPVVISHKLGLTPSWSWSKGTPRGSRQIPTRSGIWGFDTNGILTSRDVRRHLDWLLDHLEPHAATLAALQAEGYQMDVFCLWCRDGGTGGPMLSPRNMARLAALDLTIGFEFWSVDEDDDEDEVQEHEHPSKSNSP